MTKISTLSDQPFSFSPKNVIFGVKIMKFLIPGQNFGIFASSIKGMDTFLFEMSMKWMFRFNNFRNVYWHGIGKTHSAVVLISTFIGIWWPLLLKNTMTCLSLKVGWNRSSNIWWYQIIKVEQSLYSCWALGKGFHIPTNERVIFLWTKLKLPWMMWNDRNSGDLSPPTGTQNQQDK